ncbi:MAG TPA: HdeD family acid-resistance protein [Acidimicrobiia bacterium]|nr:HdeD family acid-resistance protein [Acidimicrobiia bacterium]
MDTLESDTLATTARNWWGFVVRGVLAIMFGLAALIWPDVTLVVLVALFGAYALIEGIFAVVFGFSGRDNVRWWTVLWGLVSVAAGVIVFLWPGIGALALIYVIAAWAVVTGATEIAAAIALRKEITNEWALVLAGIVSIVVGGILAIFPGAGAISLVWLIGAYAIVFGILLLVVGFRVREWRATPASPAA